MLIMLACFCLFERIVPHVHDNEEAESAALLGKLHHVVIVLNTVNYYVFI